MELGNTMGLLGQLIEQNPDILNQIQSPQGVTPLPDPRYGAGGPTFGNILPDQGFGGLPGASQGINLPINIGNNPSFNPMQQPVQQPVQNQMPVANSFLDQLQQSAGLLNEQVRNVVPQNQFVGNQFQMPYNFGGGFNTPYNSGTYTPGGYTPGQFNQYGNVPVTGNIPSNVSTTTIQDRGGNGPNQQNNQRGYESIGGMNLSINPATGRIEILEDGTLQSNLLTDIAGLQKYTPTGLLSSALGGLTNSTDYGRQLDRIESQYGKPVADEIAQTVMETYRGSRVQPTGILSSGPKPGTEVTSNGVQGFINSQGNFQRGTLIGKLDADLPGGVNYEANKLAKANIKAVEEANRKVEAERQARETRNSRPSTGGASREKQQANRDLGASRGPQTGGGQKLGR